MSLIEKNDEGLFLLDDYIDFHESKLIHMLEDIVEKDGFDTKVVTSGTIPGPDFGYFWMADSYWRTSMCVYFIGVSKGFYGIDAGFVEPWLFNFRHFVELIIKGFLMQTQWYEELNKDEYKRSRKEIASQIEDKHNLMDLYKKYKHNINIAITNWNHDAFGETPEIKPLLLSDDAKNILEELSLADDKGFRFRYPSIKVDKNKHVLSKYQGIHDKSEQFPFTGLPRKAGIYFDHIQVLNKLHDLKVELSSIKAYHDSIDCFVDELQSNADLNSFGDF